MNNTKMWFITFYDYIHINYCKTIDIYKRKNDACEKEGVSLNWGKREDLIN